MAGSAEWKLTPGQTILRSALHDEFGGNRQGGIAPSARYPEVFVFTTPAGHQHGYTDRLRNDGLFHYTGQGQTGDQTFTGANRVLLEHKQRGMAVRVFLGVSGTTTYVGEFEVDDERPTYWETAPSTAGGPERRVIVFRLRPLPGAALPLLEAIAAQQALDGLPRTGPWSRQEVEVAVRAYVGMLQDETAGRPYRPANVVDQLVGQLPGRTAEAVETRFRGISGALEQEGSGWIEDFEPTNDQAIPVDLVRSYVGPGHSVGEALAAYGDAASPPLSDRILSTDDVLVPVPSAQRSSTRRSRVGLAGSPISALQDFRKKKLGNAGEQWVIDLERERLRRSDRPDLADRIRWMARESDSHGYDVKSFDIDGRERFIEVKTTNYGVSTPFYITRNEVDVSVEHPDQYSLYRVHGFQRDPHIYILEGSVEETATLEPKVFLGLPRASEFL
jgi:hypothetical protein